jgi:hypothetical protein
MSRKLKEGDGSKTNQTIGPAASMAPESIRNGTYSKKSGKFKARKTMTPHHNTILHFLPLDTFFVTSVNSTLY